MEEKWSDRWWVWDTTGGEDESKESELENVKEAVGQLGDNAARRYRRFRRSVEQLEAEKIGQELFGLLLSAESLRDELRVLDEERSSLVHLAQTGFHVRQLQRLHAVLDAAVASYPIQFDEMSECGSWEPMLRDERRARADWYRRELERVDSGGDSSLVDEIDSDAKAEEIMTLLKAAVNKYGPDGDEFVGEDEEASSELTQEELNVIKTTFNMVAFRSNIVIMTLPTWFVLPFEFRATFGMSTWGVDRFVPDHKDEEQFIQEASGWSELNHPHVAKFLGACHIGDEKFVVHEMVRSMLEYASVEREDRKKVWERMYEVGLALQYIYERGFVCPLVKWDHLYCARYEDRAVMLGVHLRECMGISDKEFDPVPKQSQQGMFDDARVESLVIAIVKVLDKMPKSANDEANATVDVQKVIEVYRDVVSVPNPAPSCLLDHELRLLKQLREITNGEFLRVVDTLGELAEVHSRHDWLEYVPMLECQIEGITRVKDMKATLMGETIDQLLLKCREATTATNQPICSLVRRFDNIIGQLQQKFDEQSDWSNLLKPVAHLCSLLRQFSSLVKQQVQMNSFSHSRSMSVSASASVSSRASTAYSQQTLQQLDPGRVYSLHSKLDQFLILHELSPLSQIHEWLREWKDEYRSISSSLVEDKISATFDTKKVLSTGSSVLSRWFIPREQIDFDEHGAFSEGAFGSVHKGKWFQTPVIVKRVKQHTTTETQFRQEADVWFQLNHINVVKMYGACDIGDLFFVCEYASGGDLDKYLDSKGRDPYLMWYCLLNAALGLQYLHNNGIVHADLKANNILVGGDGVAKLTDFGLSVRAKDPSGASAGALGAYQWKAPECLSGSVATFASDVYSFAMVMIEVMSGSCPWGNGTEDMFVKVQVKRGLLPPRPSSIGDSEWGLIERMCTRNPSERVSMDTVVTQLSSLLQKLDQEQLWRGGVAQPKTFKNHIVSRRGILLSLMKLATTNNDAISVHACNQIVSVAESRNGPSSQREIDAVLKMLFYGTTQQQGIAANAVGALVYMNDSLLTLPTVVSQLVAITASGAAEVKKLAASAIGHVSTRADISASLVHSNGIDTLLQLVRTGTDDQKTGATRALANLSGRGDISASVLSLNGIEVLLQLVRYGSNDQKEGAIRALANLSCSPDTHQSVLSSHGVDPILQLARHGSNNQKEGAARTLANLSNDAGICASVLSSHGIDVLSQLVRNGSEGQKYASVVALTNISCNVAISASAFSSHGVDALLQLARNGTSNQNERALEALAAMSVDAGIGASILSLNGVDVLLQLVRNGSNNQKTEATRTLVNLSGRADISASLVHSNGIDTLLQLVRTGTDDQKTEATRALANLSGRGDISASVLSLNGIEVLLQLVRYGSNDQKEGAIRALANFTMHANICVPVLALNGVDPILQLARHGTNNQKDEAARTLVNMTNDAAICASVLSLNGIDVLVQLMRNGSERQKDASVMMLAGMSGRVDISASVLSANGTNVLLELARNGTSNQRDGAVKALANLALDPDVSQLLLSLSSIKILLQLVQNGTEDQKHASAVTLANLSDHTDISESVLVLDGVSTLLQLTKYGTTNQKEGALRTLENLSVNGAICASIVSLNGVDALLQLVQSGNNNHKTKAVTMLANASIHTDISALVISLNGIDTLLQLVRTGTDDQKTEATRVLVNLSCHGDISASVLSLNGVEALLQLVRCGTDSHKTFAVVVLIHLSGSGDISTKMVSLNGFDALIELVRNGTDHQKQFSAHALANFSVNTDISDLILAADVFESLVKLVCDGSNDQKQHASRTLVNLPTSAAVGDKLLATFDTELLIELLCDGNNDQKMFAAWVLANLPDREDIDKSTLAVCVVDPLMQLTKDGNDDQKTHAAQALASLSAHTDVSEYVLGVYGIESLVGLVCDGTNEQKQHASRTLVNLPNNSAVGEKLFAVFDIESSIELLCVGNNDQKMFAAWVLANLPGSEDIDKSTLAVCVVEPLVQLTRDGTDCQKKLAAQALANLSAE